MGVQGQQGACTHARPTEKPRGGHVLCEAVRHKLNIDRDGKGGHIPSLSCLRSGEGVQQRRDAWFDGPSSSRQDARSGISPS